MEAKRSLPEGQFPTPTTHCTLCNRNFHGQNCLTKHLQRGNSQSTCEKIKTCSDCCKTYEIEFNKKGHVKGRKHKCGWSKCDICEKHVELAEHLCYIQPIGEDEDLPKCKRVLPSEVGERTVVDDQPDKNGKVLVEKEPPLFVYADYEAITDIHGIQTPILLGYETSESDECHLLYGPDCTTEFFETLEDIAIDTDGNDRQVIVLFHNLKGYDGMFLLKYCYENHREVSCLVTTGAKTLSFASDRLVFKDSLCFLPFPLSAFPATFGLTELCKGYVPHLFNTEENQTYEGPMPDVTYYDPDGMAPKKRADFLQWHHTKVNANYVFNLQEEMKAYCESDVKLLKAGCEAFVKDFKKEAEFNPLEKCITIASACNRYWRKKKHRCSRTSSRMERCSNQSILCRSTMARLEKPPTRQCQCYYCRHPRSNTSRLQRWRSTNCWSTRRRF